MPKKVNVASWVFRGFLLFLSLGSIHGQSSRDDTGVPPPSEEAFKPSANLLIPWRDGGCAGSGNNALENLGCYKVTDTQFDSITALTLYGEDASAWSTFDLNPKNPLFFNKHRDLIPFATPGFDTGNTFSVWLRVTGESDHWYRVIANEDLGSVAYALKTDSAWTKSSFEYWFNGFRNIVLPKDNPPDLLDAPNGKPVPEARSARFKVVSFVKLDRPDGEWAFVEGKGPANNQRGWIRWREGRKFLVGCVFSNRQFVAP